jgi:hypothetical protein
VTTPPLPAPGPTSAGPGSAGPVTGQDIGVAARATRTVLDRFLAGAGTDFATWFALRRLSQAGEPLPRNRFVHLLVDQLGIDPASALLLVQRETAHGWLAAGVDGALELTPEGSAFYAILLAGVTAITSDLYGGIDPGDLAAARRVLVEVAHRATARGNS